MEGKTKVRLVRSVDKPRSALKSASSNRSGDQKRDRSVTFTNPLFEVHYFDPKQTLHRRYKSNEHVLSPERTVSKPVQNLSAAESVASVFNRKSEEVKQGMRALVKAKLIRPQLMQ